MIPSGRSFFKMSGSGNDFIMVDARLEPAGQLADPEVVERLCARATGVGADGIAFLEPSAVAAVRLIYLNADGSAADFCGNATLCTARLAVELGAADAAGFDIETESGLVRARFEDGMPEIELPAVTRVDVQAEGIELGAGERRAGYSIVGVPHMVIWCDDVATVDVVGRGRPLRNHPSLPHGANINFVSARSDGGLGWRMRTYERGVEAETLACGSGAVATAILLDAWGQTAPASSDSTDLQTSSGRVLRVRVTRQARAWLPTLGGEARIVFRGILSEP
jgi:diaminopimelate epimerase